MATRQSDLSAKSWNKQKAVERRVAANLQTLTNHVARIAKKHNTLEEITAAIAALTESPSWEKYAFSQAVQMVKMISVENARTWREAARRGQNSYKIYQALKAEITHNAAFVRIIKSNADLIGSLPDDVARHVTKHAATQAVKGLRAESFISHIKKAAPQLSNSIVQLIARTETAKTQAAITQVRAQQVGIQYYVWRTAEDQRVRSSHKHMNGVICQYSSPPSPEALKGEENVGYYGPGEIWNCRCYAEPVIDPEYLPNSVKVVKGGQMVRMTRKQFEQISGQ